MFSYHLRDRLADSQAALRRQEDALAADQDVLRNTDSTLRTTVARGSPTKKYETIDGRS